MRITPVLLAASLVSFAAIVACSSSSGGNGTPTPTPTQTATPTPTPFSGTLDVVTGSGGLLTSTGAVTPGSIFHISVTINGTAVTDSGEFDVFGPITGVDTYDIEFSGTAIAYFDLTIPSAQWTSNGTVAVDGTAGPVTFIVNAPGFDIVHSVGGGSVKLDTSPTIEDDPNSKVRFHLTNAAPFSN